jgi:hypothetical protein
MQRVLADPDLLAGYDNAKVMAAVADIAAHPQHAARHMTDPEASHGHSQTKCSLDARDETCALVWS